MPWKPGQTGNPFGAKRRSEEQRKFEKWAREQAWRAEKVIESKLISDKFEEQKWAVETLLNRAFGTPVQVTQADIDVEHRLITAESIKERAESLGFPIPAEIIQDIGIAGRLPISQGQSESNAIQTQ